MKLKIEDLKDFCRGAAFLGTGGGGDPYVGRLLVQQEMEKGCDITILDPIELDDDALVIPVAGMGAPTVMAERFPRIESLLVAIRAMEKKLGKKASAVMPIEVGGINSTVPLVVAARTGMPVVDADGMGRAFPELQMVTFGIYDCKAAPVVLTNDHEDIVTVETQVNERAEKLARNVVISMGGEAHIALYPMSGKQVKETGVLNTLSLALDIGRAISNARKNKADAFEGLTDYLANSADPRVCKILFHGKIVDLSRETKAGFTVGKAVIDGIGGQTGRCEVIFQNENLAAYKDGKLVAIVPDLVCILDSETADPITTETLKYGQRVKVVGVSVPDIMRSSKALSIFGPPAFGFSEAYVTIEDMQV